MTEYFKAQNKTNELLINNSLKSDYRWADNKVKNFQYLSVKKGEIYQFEFGKNFVPEMSYEHRGMVIGIRKKLLYVLPIFSYDSEKQNILLSENIKLYTELETLQAKISIKSVHCSI